MELKLDSKIQHLVGVGPKIAEKLNRLGIENVRDLFFYFPRRYEDYTTTTPIKDLGSKIKNETTFTIKGQILGIANKKTRRRGFTVTEAVVTDETGSIKVVWFNQPYLAKMLKTGSTVILNGKVSFDYFSHGLVMESPARASRPMIVPVYGETEGLSSYFIAKLVSSIKYLVTGIEEWLPLEFLCHSRHDLESTNLDPGSQATVRDDNCLRLLPIQKAILSIHFPTSLGNLQQAQRRLAFDELFFISLRANISLSESKKHKAEALKADIPKLKKFIDELPYELTGDQKKALWAIIGDIEKTVPMNRLLNGDVGSGKTIVAALASLVALQNGKKTIIMCPTSILANQHYNTFCKIFSDTGIRIGLMTAGRKESSTANNQQPIKSQVPTFNQNLKPARPAGGLEIGNCDIVVGTHALIQKGVEFANIGLVVVDEQHRFGVAQRAALQDLVARGKGQEESNSKKSSLLACPAEPWRSGATRYLQPHFLSMTATPIPRTLHLALFGDLDISVIREKPADRKEIKTRFVEPQNREKAYDFIRRQIQAGRQCFVICPLIEEKDANNVIPAEAGILKIPDQVGDDNLNLFEEERKSVKAEFEKLKKIFPEFAIEMLHGKMPPKGGSASGGKTKGKEETMANFASGRANILVSTSVVEVGVDIPNATVMVIEDAERFGLAQIHQFRGRVGRGEHQSFCFLFSSTQGEKALQRLRSLEAVSDGFKLAEIDLETRGPGAIFGTEQSGLLDLKMASISDRMLVEEASTAAKMIAPEIEKYPKLKAKISEFISSKHLE